MDPILVKARTHLVGAGINPVIVQIIIQVFQALIAGCGPVPAKNLVESNPRQAWRLMRRSAMENGSSFLEAAHVADEGLKLAQASQQADYEQLAAVDMMASVNQP